jgi:hypothetical protein
LQNTIQKTSNPQLFLVHDHLPLPIPQPLSHTKKKKKQVYIPEHTFKSVDEKHKEMMQKFRETEVELLPQWQKRCAEIKRLLRNRRGLEADDLTDELDQIKTKIADWERQKSKYISDNAPFIFQYFENKKASSNKITEERNNAATDFFTAARNRDRNAKKNTFSTYRHDIHTYWKNVCNEIPSVQDYILVSEICENCGMGEYVINEEDGTYNCHNCGHFIIQYVNTLKHYNNEAPNEVSYSAYDRFVHFKEILSQFQAKETTKIPDEVVRDISNRIRKERISDLSELDYDKMRDILKTLGYTKYFEHIQLINSILGIEPPQMDKELVDTLCVLFMETRLPWTMFCPPDRTNFFNYTFVLYQLCVLVGQYQYLPYIPMIKDQKKLQSMYDIWKKICNYLDWEYVIYPISSVKVSVAGS